MKRLAVVLILFLFVLAPCASYAEYRIAVVDLYRALNESNAGKRAKTDLESLLKSKEASVDDKRKTIENLKAGLDKQSSIISAEARKTKEADLERLMRDYQRMLADSQTELKKKESDLTGDILKELRELINKIGEEEKLSLVLEHMEGLVLFSDKTLDITDKVIERYNASGKK